MKTLKLAARAGAVLLCLAASVAHAGPWTDAQGKEILETPAMRSSGNFGAHLVLTADAKKFQTAWTAPTVKPELPVTGTVKVGQTLTGYVIFAGCKAGKGGACNVSAQYRLQTPDGNHIPAGQGRIFAGRPKAGDVMALGEAAVNMGFTKGDPLGAYVLLAKVRDHNASRTLDLAAPFVLIE